MCSRRLARPLPLRSQQNPLPLKSFNYCKRSCKTFSKSETGSLPPTRPARRQRWQQLSILQAEILSMQPSPQPTVQPTVLPNVGPTVNVQLVNYSGTLRSTLDLRSPLSEGMQTSPWLATYKPITLPKFNGKTDPHQFLMSFEAAISSARGN